MAVEQRLGTRHSRALLCAYAATALAAGKTDVAKEAIKGLEKSYSDAENLPLLHAALLAKEGKGKEAQSLLIDAASKDPSKAAACSLLRVQLAAAHNDNALALEALESLPAPLSSAPAVACTKAALLERLQRPEEAAVVLESLAMGSSLQGSSKSGPPTPQAAAWVARRLAGLRLKAGDLQGAASRLGQLITLTPDVLNGR